MKATSINRVNPQFSDVRRWFDDHMLVDKIDLDDQEVYKVYSDAKWSGIFQCTSKGAQQFFVQAKPKSIIDIAILTSIYRPGPLAAKINKLWMDAINGVEYDWGDKRINKLLEKTKGLLIFQEGVMHLAEHVAGFPKEKCDEVRRAIMKRSISGGEAAKAKVDEMKSSFVEGSINNGYTRSVAENVYEKICFFSGYGFNSSHAISYAIDSYYCAWLLTHYPERWLASYLEVMSKNPEDKALASGELKRLGYQIVPIDINEAEVGWAALQGKRFMPSLTSCKGVGESAVEEIMANRPYNDVQDMLYNADGSWRHSKFNKRALESLIKVGAFASLDCIGDDKLFASYKHMHHVLIERANDIKKTTKKEPHKGMKAMYDIARETRNQFPEWTRQEFVANQVEVQGSVNVLGLIGEEMIVKLTEKGIRSIDQLEEGDKEIVWFVGGNTTGKTTKNGKKYAHLEALGPSGKPTRLSVWGWKGEPFPQFTVYLAEVKRDDFGCSTMSFKLRPINQTKEN